MGTMMNKFGIFTTHPPCKNVADGQMSLTRGGRIGSKDGDKGFAKVDEKLAPQRLVPLTASGTARPLTATTQIYI